MNTYLLSIGWWNFAGSFFMLGLFNESFGIKLMNEWTKIFKTEFKLNYWSKFWLAWAIGLNIFFGLINILSAQWDFYELKTFLIITDILAYSGFFILAVWGHVCKRMASGIWTVYVIFLFWIIWGALFLPFIYFQE